MKVDANAIQAQWFDAAREQLQTATREGKRPVWFRAGEDVLSAFFVEKGDIPELANLKVFPMQTNGLALVTVP